MSEHIEAPASSCVLCDRPVPSVARRAGPAVGFCAGCAAELDLVPIDDLTQVPASEIDRLPFGYIALDRAGVVLRFNAYESRLSGLQPRDVIGRHFFREVAPCASVQEFAGRYERMVEEDQVASVRFRYVFRFRGGERLVQIFLAYVADRGEGLIIVRELSHV